MDENKITQALAEVSTGQQYLNRQFTEFREEFKNQICKLEKQQREDNEAIRDIRYDVNTLKKYKEEHSDRIKTLENDGRFNYVRAVGSSLPTVIKIGAVAVILGVLVWGISTYVAITKTLDTLNNINNINAGQMINEYR